MANPYRLDVEVQFPPTADETNLHLLSIFHYVAAGVVALFSTFFIAQVVVGARILAGAGPVGYAPSPFQPDSTVGAMCVAVGSTFVVISWSMAALIALAARSIAHRRRHLFCLVVASASCLFVPFGTLLGVFAWVVLSKPHVKTMFQRPEAEPAYGPIP